MHGNTAADGTGGNDAEAEYSKQRVAVAGSATLDTVDAATFDTSGSATVDGDVRAGRVDSAGRTTVGGDFVAEQVDSSGKTRVDGDFRALELDSSGKLSVGGALEADRVDSSGTVEVSGETRVDSLHSSGSLLLADAVIDTFDSSGSVTLGELRAGDATLSGTVEADRIDAESLDIELADDASVGHIVADEVRVRRADENGGLLDRLIKKSESQLTVDEIEAVEVDIEHTVAETVEGETVRLGPGTTVDVVRADELHVDDDASFGRRVER